LQHYSCDEDDSPVQSSSPLEVDPLTGSLELIGNDII
jgi:hypothetical protein